MNSLLLDDLQANLKNLLEQKNYEVGDKNSSLDIKVIINFFSINPDVRENRGFISAIGVGFGSGGRTQKELSLGYIFGGNGNNRWREIAELKRHFL